MEIDDKLNHGDIDAFLATIPAPDPKRRGSRGKRWKQSIEQRARSYARGAIDHDDGTRYDPEVFHSSSQVDTVAHDWQRGYEAAFRDVRQVWSMRGVGRATAMYELLKTKRGR